MENNGTVCAIVSAYKSEKGWLTRRIEDLMKSSIPPKQIPTSVQKGSTEALELIPLIDKYVEIDVIRTDDIPTLYKTWNDLGAICTCDYITNANLDDYIYHDGLERMSTLLDRNLDVDVVYGNVEVCVEKSLEIATTFNWVEGGYEELKHGCFVSPMPMWRKSLHDEGYWYDPELIAVGDYDFWLRLARDGKRFMKVYGAPVGLYTERQESIAHKYSKIAIIEESILMDKHEPLQMMKSMAKLRDEGWD